MQTTKRQQTPRLKHLLDTSEKVWQLLSTLDMQQLMKFDATYPKYIKRRIETEYNPPETTEEFRTPTA